MSGGKTRSAEFEVAIVNPIFGFGAWCGILYKQELYLRGIPKKRNASWQLSNDMRKPWNQGFQLLDWAASRPFDAGHSFQRWNGTPSLDWLWAIATIDDIPMRGLCDRSLAWPASYPSGALESPGNSAMNLRGNLCWFAIEYTKKVFWNSLWEHVVQV